MKFSSLRFIHRRVGDNLTGLPIGCVPTNISSETRIATLTIGSEAVIDLAIAVISGVVVGGGDTIVDGLTDAPRTFIYDVEMEDGTVIKVAYTAFPPSPVADRQESQIRLEFYQGTIMNGDYLFAHGSYDVDTGMFMVVEEGDYIETYSEKP